MDIKIISVVRNNHTFYFKKMWWYIIKIPGGIPGYPLDYYYYIGITTADDPMGRIKRHVTEVKNNKEFEELRELVPFDLWEIEYFEVPIKGDDGDANIDRLTTIEVMIIAKYDTFLGEHGLNATPGGEDPFTGALPPGHSSGVYYVYYSNTHDHWAYDDGTYIICRYNLRDLQRILEANNMFHKINDTLWQESLKFNDSRLNHISHSYGYLGAHNVSVNKSVTSRQRWCLKYQCRINGVKYAWSRNSPADFLENLKNNPEIDEHEKLYDPNRFAYCCIALIQNKWDFKKRQPIDSFMTEETFREKHNFSRDKIDELIEFLRVAEVLRKGQKVIQPQTINT